MYNVVNIQKGLLIKYQGTNQLQKSKGLQRCFNNINPSQIVHQ